MAAVQASNNKSRFQPSGSVSNSSLCSWREISGYREHSESDLVVDWMETRTNQPLNCKKKKDHMLFPAVVE